MFRRLVNLLARSLKRLKRARPFWSSSENGRWQCELELLIISHFLILSYLKYCTFIYKIQFLCLIWYVRVLLKLPLQNRCAGWLSECLGSRVDKASQFGISKLQPWPALWASFPWCFWRLAPACWAPWSQRRAALWWIRSPLEAARWRCVASKMTSMPGRTPWARRIRLSFSNRQRTNLSNELQLHCICSFSNLREQAYGGSMPWYIACTPPARA